MTPIILKILIIISATLSIGLIIRMAYIAYKNINHNKIVIQNEKDGSHA